MWIQDQLQPMQYGPRNEDQLPLRNSGPIRNEDNDATTDADTNADSPHCLLALVPHWGRIPQWQLILIPPVRCVARIMLLGDAE
jgi:hypothetical protein